MPNSGLKGPYRLENSSINYNVSRTNPGAYALGHLNTENTFIVEYVGRADDDVAQRLSSWVGKKYPLFKFDYFATARDAFYKECELFHMFGGTQSLDNEIHPDKPKNQNLLCPVCRQ